PQSALEVALHEDECRSAQRADAALCERRGRRLRRAVPADGTAALPLLLASRHAPAGGGRLFPRDSAQDPSCARDLPGGRQHAVLGVRDRSLGLSRSTAVLAAHSTEYWYANSIGRVGAV